MMTKMMTTKMDDDDEVQFHSPKCKYPRDTSWIYFSFPMMFDAMVQCIVSIGQIYIVGFATSWKMTVQLNGQNEVANLLDSVVLNHILLTRGSWNGTNFEYTMEQAFIRNGQAMDIVGFSLILWFNVL